MKLMRWLRRITGISLPFLGLQWQPPEDERRILYEFIQRIGDRRAIKGEHHCLPLAYHEYGGGRLFEIKPRALLLSLDEVRRDATTALANLDPDSELRESLEYIRRITQDFYQSAEQLESSSGEAAFVSVPEQVMLEWRKYLFCLGSELLKLDESYSLGFGHSRKGVLRYLFSRVREIPQEGTSRELSWYLTSREKGFSAEVFTKTPNSRLQPTRSPRG